jgi:extracellular factor (EF) 3-hydroxypalmitic acid methyl ester biosynthesis protein
VARSTLEFLTENDWSLILAKAKRVRYAPGEEIIQQGRPGKAIHILQKGSASVQVTHPEGRSEIAVLGPKEICGDISFLLKDEILKDKTSASVRATGEVEADQVDAEELGQVFEAFPSVAARFYHSLAVLLARRLRETSLALANRSGKYKEAIR